jgi:starch synthase (maltosyl-transferring)
MSSHDQSHLPAVMQERRLSHIVIDDVSPSTDSGRYPIKRVIGEPCVVEADIFRDGHQILRAVLQWRVQREEDFAESRMTPIGNDRWRGEFIPTENTRYIYRIEAWTDIFASWLADFSKKVTANRDVSSDRLEGIAYLEAILRHADGTDAEVIRLCLDRVRRVEPVSALDALSDPRVAEVAAAVSDRFGATRSDPPLELVVDRPKARFSSWYEMFIRSQGSDPAKPATFREAESRLADIRDLGFDVLYLPPIHPIGRTNRKGPGNSLSASNGAVGSPWAIGNEAGGHTAVDPALGTIADFERFVATARRLGLEVALDFAVQSSPDHPWVREHPSWFQHRPDGSIKYAENPPKEYQDIYPIDFDTPDQRELVEELHRVLKFWIDHGVTIFRVDNPHTKPIAVWGWLIKAIQSAHPEVIFLAEAFTRPKIMKSLAKAGFTQSYTYFTWRNSKAELIEYLTELSQSPVREYCRPNFFVNTPDILPPILQTGGRPAFKQRLVLAATLSPAYGIYSGFELCENQAVPGTEEYLASEKYEIKVRNWNAPENIKEYIAKINSIRFANPALQELTNLCFLSTDNVQVLSYCKTARHSNNVMIIAVNLDPSNVQSCSVVVPPELVGASAGQQYRVKDLISGRSFVWSERNYVRLDPGIEPAHILRVEEVF